MANPKTVLEWIAANPDATLPDLEKALRYPKLKNVVLQLEDAQQVVSEKKFSPIHQRVIKHYRRAA